MSKSSQKDLKEKIVLSEHQGEGDQNAIKKDPYRFVNLALYVSVGCVNSLPAQAFAGIAPAIKDIYGLSALQVNLNSLFFPILYVFMILPANFVIDQKGLKPGLLFCEVMMCLGLGIRCLLNLHFELFLLGTFLCSLGFCFMVSSANKFANLWFPEDEIFIANSMALFSLFASDSIGFYISTIFINKQSTQVEVQMFFIIQSGIIIVLNVLMIVFFKGKPNSPQNFSSSIQRQNYSSNLKSLSQHKNYRMLFLSMTCVFSTLSIIFVGVSWFGEVYNFSTEQCGYIILFSNAGGLFGCVISTKFKKDRYKSKCQMYLVGSIIGLMVLILGEELETIEIIYLGAAFAGFNLFPFLTTISDYSTQTTFPIGEATAGGSLLFGGQTVGFLLIILFSLYINDEVTLEKVRIVEGSMLLLLLLGLVSLSLSQEKLERKLYESQKKIENISIISET